LYRREATLVYDEANLIGEFILSCHRAVSVLRIDTPSLTRKPLR
jgi:hypothetical protein